MPAAVLLGRSRRAPVSCRESRLLHPARPRWGRRRLEFRALKSRQQPRHKGIDHRPGTDLEARAPVAGGESKLIAIGPFRTLQGALLEEPEQGPGAGGLKDSGAGRGWWIKYQPDTARGGLTGPGDLCRALRTVSIDYRRAADIEGDLRYRGIEVNRCDVEAHRRSVAGSEEQFADHTGFLELCEVGRRHGRRHAVDRVRLPAAVSARVDVRPQLSVEEAVDQSSRREQPTEVVHRDVDRRARDKRVTAIHGLLAQRGGPTAWGIPSFCRLLARPSADQRIAASRQRATGGGAFPASSRSSCTASPPMGPAGAGVACVAS